MLRAIFVSIVALVMLATTAPADPLAELLSQCELESGNVNMGQSKPPCVIVQVQKTMAFTELVQTIVSGPGGFPQNITPRSVLRHSDLLDDVGEPSEFYLEPGTYGFRFAP